MNRLNKLLLFQIELKSTNRSQKYANQKESQKDANQKENSL